MVGIIDRFEGKFAVVELKNNKMINIEKIRLPVEAMEGDVINIEDKITINQEETYRRRKNLEEITKDIWL